MTLAPGDFPRLLDLLPRSSLFLVDVGHVESGARHLPVHLGRRHYLLGCVCGRRCFVDALFDSAGEYLRAQLGRSASLSQIRRRILLRIAARRRRRRRRVPSVVVETAASAHVTAALSARGIRVSCRLPECLRFLFEVQRAVLAHFLAAFRDRRHSRRTRRVRRRLPGVRNQTTCRPIGGRSRRGDAIDRSISESRTRPPS